MARHNDKAFESFLISKKLVSLSKKAAKDLGLSRAGFYRYCITKVLGDLGYLSDLKITKVDQHDQRP